MLDKRRASVYKGGMSNVTERLYDQTGEEFDPVEAQEAQDAEEFDAWCAENGLDCPPEGTDFEEFLRQRWEASNPRPSYNGPEDDDISF